MILNILVFNLKKEEILLGENDQNALFKMTPNLTEVEEVNASYHYKSIEKTQNVICRYK